MDEPFAALDYFTREQMQKKLLRVRQKQRCSILFVTHSIDEALLLGHKIVVIENGLVKTQVRVPELEGATGGLTVDDVEYVNMSIADAKAALDGGSVDAALIAGAAAYQAKQQGYHMAADGEGLIKAIIAVAVREDFYEKNRDVIGRFVEAQKRVGAFMKDNQDEALQIVAEELDLDEEAVREMYACYDFSMDVTDEDKKGFQKTADFMLESGMIEEELNVNSLFL